MGPVKVLATASSCRGGLHRTARAVLCGLFVACALAAVGPSAAVAQETEHEEVLPGSGIRYPRGYDAETEGVIEGRVLRIEIPPSGPVRVHLESARRPVTVLTSPVWYWEQAEGKPAKGDLVRVVGSKTVGADGELYVVAREILPVGSGCCCRFRDEAGHPLWSGRMRGMSPPRCAPPAPPGSAPVPAPAP